MPTSEPQTLVILTAAYPFGRTWETFLEPELRILAQRFPRIIVMPSSTDPHMRSLPVGVQCEPCLADASRMGLFNELIRRPIPPLLQYGRAVLEENLARPYLRKSASYVGVATLHRWKYRVLGDFIEREGLHGALFYDYWLTNSALALALLRRRGIIRRAVARAHGFDLYDEQGSLGAVPYRGFVISSLDRVFTISENGLSYLLARHPKDAPKLTLSRLGIEGERSETPRDSGPMPRIVSCGSLTPLKRVDLIPSVLAQVNRPLQWIHFGDGSERATVERAASMLTKPVTWELRGHVDHDELIDYYAKNKVDLFISLSASEGVPVSIMEAISFGVPVLATAVGGVPEIVTSSTGVLVKIDEAVTSIAERARELLDGTRPPSSEITAFFQANYDAQTNYNTFADLLLAV